MFTNRYFMLWWLMFWMQMAGIAVFAYAGLFPVLLKSDPTFISFGIMSLLFVSSMYAGFLTYKSKLEKVSTEIGWFLSECMMTLGMIGTVIGFLIMLGAVFSGGMNFSDTKGLQALLIQMSVGMSAALWTTAVGLVCSLIMKIQLMNLEKSIEN